jgi:hypothetical protein
MDTMTDHRFPAPLPGPGIDTGISIAHTATMKDRAVRADKTLRRLEADAEALGGRELSLILECARESLRRRWGPLE